LRGVLAVVAPLETALARWFAPEGGATRADCLRADLARLDAWEPSARPPVRLPASRAEAYGCAYVLEGSTLGGLVLAPLVSSTLGRDAPTSYLRLRGADTARAWRAWLKQLHAFGATATVDDTAAACNMACAAFDAYIESLALAGALKEGCACTT
jgi:heme oxygenase